MLVLFGSQVTGKLTFHSDIDVALLLRETLHRFEHPVDWPEVPPDLQRIDREIVDLMGKLNDFFLSDQVDMTILTPETDPLLAYEIFRGGVPLFEEKPGLFDQWYLRSWKIYLDTAKFRELEWERTKEALKRMREKDVS